MVFVPDDRPHAETATTSTVTMATITRHLWPSITDILPCDGRGIAAMGGILGASLAEVKRDRSQGDDVPAML